MRAIDSFSLTEVLADHMEMGIEVEIVIRDILLQLNQPLNPARSNN
jgi:hypothetical protein